MKTFRDNFFMLILCSALLIGTGKLSAQTIEINGFTGYQFGGRVQLYDGDFKINNAQNYGGKLAIGLSPETFAEISYMRMDTEGQLRPFVGVPSDYIDFSTNYIQVAGLQQLNYGIISPYATLGVGLVWFAPVSNEYRSQTQFSATFGAGIKIWLADMIGIRLQGSMLMPMVFNGVGFGCGIGTGGASCGSNLYTRITPFQGEFSGGLIIRISTN